MDIKRSMQADILARAAKANKCAADHREAAKGEGEMLFEINLPTDTLLGDAKGTLEERMERLEERVKKLGKDFGE